MSKPFQFSLRTLFAVIALVGWGIVVVPHWIKIYPEQRQPASPNLVQASGIVTLNGVPLEGVIVEFLPVDQDGLMAAGRTDARGIFSLKTLAVGYAYALGGATPGASKISVLGRDVVRDIPERYTGVETRLTAEVTKHGPNFFTFDLTTP